MSCATAPSPSWTTAPSYFGYSRSTLGGRVPEYKFNFYAPIDETPEFKTNFLIFLQIPASRQSRHAPKFKMKHWRKGTIIPSRFSSLLRPSKKLFLPKQLHFLTRPVRICFSIQQTFSKNCFVMEGKKC